MVFAEPLVWSSGPTSKVCRGVGGAATTARPGASSVGLRCQEHGLVFASKVGTPLDPSQGRRELRRAIRDAAGLNPRQWTPRELRHSFVSLLSDSGVPLEEISRLVGYNSTAVTGLIYRKQIRPVLQRGATVMDRIFSNRS